VCSNAYTEYMHSQTNSGRNVRTHLERARFVLVNFREEILQQPGHFGFIVRARMISVPEPPEPKIELSLSKSRVCPWVVAKNKTRRSDGAAVSQVDARNWCY